MSATRTAWLVLMMVSTLLVAICYHPADSACGVGCARRHQFVRGDS